MFICLHSHRTAMQCAALHCNLLQCSARHSTASIFKLFKTKETITRAHAKRKKNFEIIERKENGFVRSNIKFTIPILSIQLVLLDKNFKYACVTKCSLRNAYFPLRKGRFQFCWNVQNNTNCVQITIECLLFPEYEFILFFVQFQYQWFH